jgi:hypothetical protein
MRQSDPQQATEPSIAMADPAAMTGSVADGDGGASGATAPARCRWEEKLPGFGGPRRCGAPTAEGKPWCDAHSRRFEQGRAMRGRGHSAGAAAGIRSALYGS